MTAPPSGRTAVAAALALLTGRALTAGELVVRLERRGYPPDQIDQARARVAALGLLDDRRTAVAWAESAARTRGLGPQRLREGLARRGVDGEIIEDVVASLFPPDEEASQAAAALARWGRSGRREAGTDRLRAAFAHLRRRGYSGAVARAALFKYRESE